MNNLDKDLSKLFTNDELELSVYTEDDLRQYFNDGNIDMLFEAIAHNMHMAYDKGWDDGCEYAEECE